MLALDTQKMETLPTPRHTLSMTKTAVVILNWNGSKYLQQFLPTLIACTDTTDTRLIIADNGSTDNSHDVVLNFRQVEWLALDKNYGFAEGYNRALQHIQAKYYVLLNNDVEVTPQWLTGLIDYMDAHPDTAACQPKIRSYHNRNRFEHAGAAGGLIDKWGYPYCRGRLFDHTEQDSGQYEQVTHIFWATGACLCIRSHDYHMTGGLDAEFFAHMEEIDLCWRLGCRGKQIAYVPGSMIYHVGGGSLPKSDPRKDYLNFRNNLLMLYKNLPPARFRWVAFIRFFMDYAAALQYLLKGNTASAKAVWQARCDYHRMKHSASFRTKRRINQQTTTIPYPYGIENRSIVWDYYIRKKLS